MMTHVQHKAAMSIAEFCSAHGISRGLLYLLWKRGAGPRILKVGRRRLITAQAAAAWRDKMSNK